MSVQRRGRGDEGMTVCVLRGWGGGGNKGSTGSMDCESSEHKNWERW